MADNKTLWTWGNQQKYHEELMQEIEDNTGSSTPVLNTSTGNPITITDGADAPLIELGVYGRSSQDGTPTPDTPIDIVSVGDDGNVEITACGKNLIEGSQDFSGTWIYPWATSEETYQNLVVKEHTGAWNGTAKKVYIKEGKTYTFSAYVKQSENDTITLYTIPNQNMNIANGADVSKHSLLISVTTEWQRFTHTFTCIKSGYAVPRVESSTSSTTVYICGFQLEESDLMTEYEPYKGNAVTITSGLPLCSIDSVKDELIYNADGTGKIIKRTAKIVLDGSNDEAWQHSEGNAPFQITISDGSLWENRTELPKLYCNKYQRVPQGATWGSYDYMVSTNTNGTLLAIRDISVTTLEEFKAKLNAVPMAVVYVLATPKEIELSSAEMAEFMQLQTFNGVTNIYNDESAEMNVKYWCDDTILLLSKNSSDFNTFTGTREEYENESENIEEGTYVNIIDDDSVINSDGFQLLFYGNMSKNVIYTFSEPYTNFDMIFIEKATVASDTQYNNAATFHLVANIAKDTVWYYNDNLYFLSDGTIKAERDIDLIGIYGFKNG